MTPEEISLLPYRPCVGIVLINKNKNIFGAQRIDSKTNAWQMPQGGIDDGEKPLNAAFRELEEETGIVKVRLGGACETCAMSVMTLKQGIEKKLMSEIPDCYGVIQVL